MEKVTNAFKFLMDAMRERARIQQQQSQATKSERVTKHDASKKGFVHMIGRVFRSRSINTMTPAEYRRAHLGRTSTYWANKKLALATIPNYKKPSAPPRGRNVPAIRYFVDEALNGGGGGGS